VSMDAEDAIVVRTVGSPGARGMLRSDRAAAGVLVAIPVRTMLVNAGDDIVETVARAVHGIAHCGDVIAVSETAVAIAQGRAVPAELVRPSRLAYALSRRAGILATVNQPESLQLVIDRVGAWRVLYAAVAHVAGRLAGKRGMFYRVLGEAIAAIDGYTGTLPPFERTIVLGPEDPAGVAAAIAARTGAHAAIVDVNDLGIAKALGASAAVRVAALEDALRTNPHGNGDEQTPIVVLAWRGAGDGPLAQAAEERA
jgi:F420-0:gamma-glutamyl ligase